MTNVTFMHQEQIEADFHDQWAKDTDIFKIDIETLFQQATGPENARILKWMGDLKGKRILELGCGLGEASVLFAKRGAIVTATDISPEMLQFTQRLAALHEVSLKTILVSANDLSAIPNQSFDYVYAANVLHHVDLESCLSQVTCKLNPAGVAFFWDPIQYNPAINLYRKLAAAVRTPGEHPLTISDMQIIRKYFPKIQIRFFWYSALVIFVFYFLIRRMNPGEIRYWKRIHEDASKIGWWLSWLHKVDRFCFSWVPGLQWLSWNVVIRAEKQ